MKKVSALTYLYFLGVAVVSVGCALSFSTGTGLIAFGVGIVFYVALRAITD